MCRHYSMTRCSSLLTRLAHANGMSQNHYRPQRGCGKVMFSQSWNTHMATAADGTHPTGMHSCSRFFLSITKTNEVI